jgi:nitroreductase
MDGFMLYITRSRFKTESSFMSLYAGKPSPEVLDYLLKRRSVKPEGLSAPGPSPAQLETILKAATRVPDHGKMSPWYFIVFEGEARAQMGEIIAQAFQKENPDAREDKIKSERERFLRAPLVVAIVSRVRKGKKPVWEQILSAGAAAMNFSLAAHASGFGACWLTEWYGFDENVKAAMGLDERDHIVGFLYVGSVAVPPEERERPDLNLIVNHFEPGKALRKGDEYDQEKFGIPEAGFKF